MLHFFVFSSSVDQPTFSSVYLSRATLKQVREWDCFPGVAYESQTSKGKPCPKAVYISGCVLAGFLTCAPDEAIQGELSLELARPTRNMNWKAQGEGQYVMLKS
jgi:hypothetical protein